MSEIPPIDPNNTDTLEGAQKVAAIHLVNELRQPDFFDDGSFGVELASLDAAEPKKYTGAVLESRIALRDAVCRALAEGVGIIKIARMLRSKGHKIGEHSIMALRDRRPDLVALEKKQLSSVLGRILKLQGEIYEDALLAEKIPAVQIPVAFGIFSDKKALLDGDPTSIVQTQHDGAASADAFLKRLEEMKRAKITPAPESESVAIITDVKE